MKYEVTIGIPVYKAIDYIERTMESALNQTFASIEYLIVDDCGNDGTIKVVERLQKEHQRGKDIRILYNKQNLGVGRTRNIILGKAQVLNSGYLMKLYTIKVRQILRFLHKRLLNYFFCGLGYLLTFLSLFLVILLGTINKYYKICEYFS